MTSLDNHEPSVGQALNPQSRPDVQRQQISFSLRDHLVDGIGRGSAKDLMFRPNASFHPIREVKRTGDQCELHFDRPLMELRRSVSEREVLTLLASLRLGVRECALGQELYLYPGLESFGLSSSGDLKMALINVRPKHRLVDHTLQQMSVEAFFELLKGHCPKTWARIAPHSERIVTLAALEAHLTGPTVMSRFTRFIRTLILLGIILFFCSIPIAMFGPPSMREPLREVLYPIFTRVSELLSPPQVTPATSQEGATSTGLKQGEQGATPQKAEESTVQRAAPLKSPRETPPLKKSGSPTPSTPADTP